MMETLFQIGRNIRYIWNVYIRRLPMNLYFYLPIGALINIPNDIVFRQRNGEPYFYELRRQLSAIVGKQRIFWQWRFAPNNIETIELKVLSKKKATFFLLFL